jgi:fumarate reductase flavoprotein subunit
MAMELPPGWRGYGTRDHIEHPNTAIRQGQVERIIGATPDRAERESALLPFREQLPARYRDRNARYEPGAN